MARVFWDAPVSANTYKVRLLLNLLDVPHERIVVSVMGAEPDPRVVAVHPSGRVPLVVEDGTVYAESNAILIHLARGTPWFPTDPAAQDAILPWLFFEQNSLEPQVGNARLLAWAKEPTEEDAQHLARRQAGARWALDVMERHIGAREWFAGDHATIADIALFAYAHVAPQGGVPLDPYPKVRAWMDRLRQIPGFIAMEANP